MTRRTGILFIVGFIIFIIISAINILIKRYERESISTVPQDREESISKEKVSVKKQEGLEFLDESLEEESGIPTTEPLLH